MAGHWPVQRNDRPAHHIRDRRCYLVSRRIECDFRKYIHQVAPARKRQNFSQPILAVSATLSDIDSRLAPAMGTRQLPFPVCSTCKLEPELCAQEFLGRVARISGY